MQVNFSHNLSKKERKDMEECLMDKVLGIPKINDVIACHVIDHKKLGITKKELIKLLVEDAISHAELVVDLKPSEEFRMKNLAAFKKTRN